MSNIFEFNGYRPVVDASAYVHPNATVTGNVVIGKDVYIGPGAAIRCPARSSIECTGKVVISR